MPHHDVYTLHIYRSRAPSGWQWAARLEHLPGGESRRFTDPEALLEYLRSVVRAGAHTDPMPDTLLSGESVPERAPEEGGTQV
jgi:hypothetical protein